MGLPVKKHRVQAGVARQHFPSGAGRRVALKNALNIGTES
jgi:hypothetical protein